MNKSDNDNIGNGNALWWRRYRGVELVMDEWRDEKEGNEWAQGPIGRQSKTKMARSTVPQGIMVTT
jgi:hypothetical protein